MKKFIKYLAEISGAAEEIRRDTCKEVGSNMEYYATWFTGGLLVNGHKYDMSNILHEYPKWCLNHGSPHMFGQQHINFRDKLWKLSDEQKSIILEENKSNLSSK